MIQGALAALLKGIAGKVGNKIADWVPNKKERYRNQIEKLKKEMDEILHSDNNGKVYVRDVARYERLALRLSKYEQAIKNI